MIEGDDGPDDALKGLFDQTDLNSDICFASIPGEHISCRNLQIPFKDPKKIRQTLPFEIETMVPFPIEDLVVDFAIIDRSDKSDILAVSMKKAFISEYLERLQPYGIDPDVLDIRCVPLVSRLLKQEGTPDDGLFLQIDGKRNTMVLYQKRHVVLVRTFAFDGAPVAWSASDAVNDDTGTKISEQGESYFQSFCTMVQNTVHAFESQNSRVIRLQKVFFTGGGAFWPRTKELLNRFLDIPAEQVDLSRDAKVHIDENIARIWNPALMDNALALALRDTKRGQGFNFRKGEFEKKKHYFGQKKELRKAAIIFVVVLSFLAADIGVDYYFMKKKT
jgi:general secretion pathway protein L